MSTFWSAMYSSPLVGGKTPVRILTSVDLPAPLSPMRPTISFWPTSKLMFFKAHTDPKYFSMLTMRSAVRRLGRFSHEAISFHDGAPAA